MKATPNDYRRGRHVVHDLHAHIVLTPKYRKKVFTPLVAQEVEKGVREVCANHGVTLDEFDTDLDHALLVISYPPKVCLSRLVNAIKTNTSRRIRTLDLPEADRLLWGDHFWSPSYFIASTGGAPLEAIRKYVQDQGKKPRGPGRPPQVARP